MCGCVYVCGEGVSSLAMYISSNECVCGYRVSGLVVGYMK